MDAERRFVPSGEIVPELGITEADLARDLFRRIAEGSRASAECQRLSALGVRPLVRYSTGAKPAPQGEWLPGTVVRIIHNPMYKGVSVLASRRGHVERAVPALVEPHLWDAAQQALIRNRNLSKKNAKHEYLLRGLVRCGNCGAGYAGQTITSGSSKAYPFDVCSGGKGVMHPLPEHRCRGKAVQAAKLEPFV